MNDPNQGDTFIILNDLDNQNCIEINSKFSLEKVNHKNNIINKIEI